MRHNTINAYLGLSPHMADWDWFGNNSKYRQSLPKGNLLQMAGLSMQVALAYGEPQFLITARTPEHAGIADRLQAGINRMSVLLDLGETARNIAADSYFGYGIYKCGYGHLPLSARAATGLEYGPCVWRVGQDDFLYDITASNWNNVAYIGDLYTMPFEETVKRWPMHADRLNKLADTDRLDAPRVMPKASRFHSAEAEVWLADFYFPGGVCATWPIRSESFGELAEIPLEEHEYEGHWSGQYQVLNHLYAPDELVPISQAESIKSIHFLFQDIFHLTSEQARNAKVVPIYKQGNDRDMQKLWNARDRHPVGLTQTALQEANQHFEIPGPTQSQTAYLAALMNFFKEFVPTVDEPLRAPTATQGQLDRETTNAIIAEAKRKFNRALQLVGYKLGHLMLNSNDLVLPATKQLRPGSNVMMDVTFSSSDLNPRPSKIDDFDILIEPFSTQHRTPQQRLQTIMALNQQLIAMFQAQAMGAPVNVEEALEIFSELSGEPRLKNLYEEIDPLHAAKRQNSKISAPRLGVGQYTRTSVTEKTNAGALEQNLNEIGSENGTDGRWN